MSSDAFPSPLERVAIAEKITAIKSEVAVEVTHEFFRRHPDWTQRYGPAGFQRGLEDACYHLDYLAAAIEAGSTELFERYARWTGRMLESRGIARHFVVENLEQIEEELQSRLAAAESAWAQPYFRTGMSAVAAPAAPPQYETDVAASRQLFRTAILRGQRSAAVHIAEEALSEAASAADVYIELFSKALWEVGELWERNQISVADEHRATAIAQYVIAQMYSRIPFQTQERGNVIVTGVEGEYHQLGGNIVADVLEAEGWNVCFLGTNLPHRTILTKIQEHRAVAVCISATMPFNVMNVRRLIADIRARFGPELLIVLGGQAFAGATAFFEQAGADAWAPDVRAGAAILAEGVAARSGARGPGSPE
jgi:methanogenic corrinoid protein MtbC1